MEREFIGNHSSIGSAVSADLARGHSLTGRLRRLSCAKFLKAAGLPARGAGPACRCPTAHQRPASNRCSLHRSCSAFQRDQLTSSRRHTSRAALGVTGIARRQFLRNRQAVVIGLCGVGTRRASFAWPTDFERVRDEPGFAEHITTRLVIGLQETQPRYLPYGVAAGVASRSPEM